MSDHGHNVSPDTPPSTTGPTHSRAKDPAIVRESQATVGVIKSFVRLIATLFLVFGAIAGYNKYQENSEAEAKQTQLENARRQAIVIQRMQQQTKPLVETLVLRKECDTPCSAHIAWKYQVIWGDSPIQETFPGGLKVERRGKDQKFKAPEFNEGDVEFDSLDPDRPHFRVQVYQVVMSPAP